MPDPLSILRQAEEAKKAQTAHISLWREAASFCMPQKAASIGLANGTAQFRPDPKLANSVAISSLSILVSGMVAGIIPGAQEWWQWSPSPYSDHDRVRQWLLKCTKVAHEALSASNFGSRATDFFYHAAGVGTGTLEVQEGADSPLEFRVLPIGSYHIVENGRGVVDRLFREWKLTIQQAIDLFGERALPRKLLEGDPSKRLTQEERFIFAVYPRPVEEQRDLGAAGMPIAGCVIHESTKQVVAEYGWEERPTITYRFQEGPDGSPWGVGPGVLALCDMRGVNYLDSLIARGVGKIIDPPLAAVKGSLTGPLDLTRGGVSLVNDPANRPMPIAEVGNLNVGDAFLTKKEDQLRRHFHTELFEAFLNLQREITRYEAQQRRAEQLDRFAPVFHRTTTEFVNPLLERVFMILLRSGHFPPPPREAIVQTPSGPKILYPKAIQTSRMAVSFAAIGQQAFRELMADLLPIAQVDPTVLDN